MNIWIAFFRGINVGGANILPMKDLVSLFKKLGFADVKTYIQSGNVLFQSPEADPNKLAKSIGDALLKSYGFKPLVIILRLNELKEAIDSNPFPEAESDPKSLHIYFLAKAPKTVDFESLNQLKVESEKFALTEKVFYLHSPDGIGRSKLAAKVEKAVGVPVTARNWRTASKVFEMARLTK